MKRSFLPVAALALLPWAAACNRTGEAEEAPAVQTVPVERGDLNITAEATGQVEPIRKVEVKSKASGEILKLYVDVGDKVEPGALLAEVDPRDVRNAYEQAQADLEVARARMAIAEAQLQRSRELKDREVITEQEFESATLEYSNARATLVKAETNAELAELRLGDVTIRAPMAGTILEKNVEEGQVIQSASQNVSGGTVLFVMANLDDVQVRTLVDETDMGDLKAGMEAIVKVEAYPDRTFRGAVEKIEPQAVVQQNVTMFPVIVRLDNRSGLLRPGMNAEVEVQVARATDVLLVPNNAIVTPQDAGPAAMVLGLDPAELDLRSLFRRGRGGAGGPASGAGAGAGVGGADGEAGGRRAAAAGGRGAGAAVPGATAAGDDARAAA
ncbi:MAG: efflux RND transporter periplasmic adaptor subunit, partial [Gemmatimonadetes bacterium]